jgi:hypothetical protein
MQTVLHAWLQCGVFHPCVYEAVIINSCRLILKAGSRHEFLTLRPGKKSVCRSSLFRNQCTSQGHLWLAWLAWRHEEHTEEAQSGSCCYQPVPGYSGILSTVKCTVYDSVRRDDARWGTLASLDFLFGTRTSPTCKTSAFFRCQQCSQRTRLRASIPTWPHPT